MLFVLIFGNNLPCVCVNNYYYFSFSLKIRVLPKTPQHLFTQDPVAFSYYYDQVLLLIIEPLVTNNRYFILTSRMTV